MTAPRPRARSRASARKAGTTFERHIADWLAQALGDDRVDRRVKRGNKDRGDLTGLRAPGGGRIVAELKNHARPNLPGWLREAETERGNDDALLGLVIHKRHGTTNPAHQYVTMTLLDLAALLTGHRTQKEPQ